MSGRNPGQWTVTVDGTEWNAVENLGNAAADDPVYVVDPADGRIVFGDGSHGRRPPNDALVTVAWRVGAGEAGNTVLSIATRWPPAECRYFVALAPAGIGMGTAGARSARFAGAKRPRYFAGQLLTASDLQAEQDYMLERRYRHNRVLHGFGVVSGLSVATTMEQTTPSIVVSPGFALDRHGREIELADAVVLPIAASCCVQHVIVAYAERDADPVPSLDGGGGTNASRVEEGASVRLSDDAMADDGVVLARIVQDATGWNVDGAFEPARCHVAPP